MNANELIAMYEKGAIIEDEMFSRARKEGCWQYLGKYLEEYKKWTEEHPEGGLTFSITA